MIETYTAQVPMKLYRAVYRHQSTERNLDLYARDLAHATLSAKELIPIGAEFIRAFHNPDWS